MLPLIIIVLHNACLITFCYIESICTMFNTFENMTAIVPVSAGLNGVSAVKGILCQML